MAAKPVAYPNLVEGIGAVVDAHTDMHAAIAGHAQDHHNHLNQLRTKLAMQQAAKKLTDEDPHRAIHTEGN